MGTLQINAASVTVYPATDTIDVSIWYARPPETTEYIAFWAGWPVDARPEQGFVVMPSLSQWEFTTIDYTPFSSVSHGTVPYTLTDNQLQFSLPLLPYIPENFAFEVSTTSHSLQGYSAINTPSVYVPEPSSLYLGILLWAILMSKICYKGLRNGIDVFRNCKLKMTSTGNCMGR